MKRILSLDGGGIRGIFSLQILSRIEALFRDESGKSDLRLSDVFHLIAGTSTGAIIAAFLSFGHSVSEIEQLYFEFGPLMFRPERWYRRWNSKYRAYEIARLFKEHFCERDGTPAKMGSERLRTLLLIVMRNATTGAPWPVSNNPRAYYNDRERQDCNLNVPLWQLLRASTAAPTFFPPERIEYGGRRFLFVDGAVTPFNNPSHMAVLTATLPQYRLGWPTGRDLLHVVSVGTGFERTRLPDKTAEKIHLIDQLLFCVPAIIGATAVEQDLMCRIMGDCLYGETIDREIGDLNAPSLFGPGEQKFSYVRYDQTFNSEWGSAVKGNRTDMRLDKIENMSMFQVIGREYAQTHVKREHLFPRALQGILRPQPK